MSIRSRLEITWPEWVIIVGLALVAVGARQPAEAASSRGLMCQNAGKAAVILSQDLNTEFRPEHYTHEWHRRIGYWMQRCKDDARGIRQCVQQTCESEPS